MRTICFVSFLGLGVFTNTFAADHPTFEAFPAKSSNSQKVSAIDWSSASDAKRFKTQLNRAFARGVRFAGNFAVAEFGCGTNCKVIAFVGMGNGKVIFGPVAEYDFEYRLGSRLLVANSAAAAKDLIDDGFCEEPDGQPVFSRYYEWTGAEFKLIREVDVCEDPFRSDRERNK